jgi:hypothetical protein
MIFGIVRSVKQIIESDSLMAFTQTNLSVLEKNKAVTLLVN